MTRFLRLHELLELHRRVVEQTGGSDGVRDLGLMESALAQPRMTFDGEELYPTVVEKASALAFSLIRNHPFVDGNKRIGHAAMEVFLVLNGYELDAPVDEQEQVILRLESGEMARDEFTGWLRGRVTSRK